MGIALSRKRRAQVERQHAAVGQRHYGAVAQGAQRHGDGRPLQQVDGADAAAAIAGRYSSPRPGTPGRGVGGLQG